MVPLTQEEIDIVIEEISYLVEEFPSIYTNNIILKTIEYIFLSSRRLKSHIHYKNVKKLETMTIVVIKHNPEIIKIINLESLINIFSEIEKVIPIETIKNIIRKRKECYSY